MKMTLQDAQFEFLHPEQTLARLRMELMELACIPTPSSETLKKFSTAFRPPAFEDQSANSLPPSALPEPIKKTL